MSRRRQYCCCWLDGQLLGVEIEQVQEVLLARVMTIVPLAPDRVRGLINLRGEIVPAIDLRVCFERSPADLARASNLVLRTDEGPVSLLVDAIGDVLELDDDRCQPPPPSMRGPARTLIRAVVQLEDRLLSILEPKAVLAPEAQP